MFNATDYNFDFKPLTAEPQLVIIPVNKEYGIIAVVKPTGNGKAACIAFSPATKLDNPFKSYRPTFLRRLVTTDFQLRAGSWTPLSIEKPSAMTLRSAVTALFKDFDKLDADAVKQIDMHRPTNVSSSPEVSNLTFSAPANVPFEKALGHLIGLEFTMARDLTKFQANLLEQPIKTSISSSPSSEFALFQESAPNSSGEASLPPSAEQALEVVSGSSSPASGDSTPAAAN